MIGNLIGVGIAVGIWIALLAVWPRRKQPSAKKEKITDWPAFIDDVASGVRAGLSLPYATFDAGTRLPTRQASHFQQTQAKWQEGVGYLQCLDALENQIGHAGFELFAGAAAIAYEQGGKSVPTVLTQLARSLRSGNQLFNEIKGRQAVTVNSARVAVLAPLVVLVLTGTRAEVRQAYMSEVGLFVLVSVMTISWFSYQLMKKFAQIPELDLIR
jgi:tight adherence protein B